MEELILYATPGGDFGDACDAYWERAAQLDRQTTAQAHPPHCTLTGFFHRHADRVPDIVDEVSAVRDRSGSPAVEDASLSVLGDWIGFNLEAPDFDEVIADFVATHVVRGDEERLRPKEWLHLSLAYGNGVIPAWHHDLAVDSFLGVEPSTWEVGLWRRSDEGWTRLDAAAVHAVGRTRPS